MSRKVYEFREDGFSLFEKFDLARYPHLLWPSVFILPFWLESWWGQFGKDYEPLLFSVWKEGVPVGIAPLKRKDSSVSLLGSPDVCDYLDFIVTPGEERNFFRTLFGALEQRGITNMELFCQRPEAAIFGSFFADKQIEGWRGFFEEENTSSEVQLAGSWELYLAGLQKKQRHEVRRKLRKLETETHGFRYRRLAEKNEVIGYIPFFLDLFLQNPEKQGFLNAGMEKFFYRLITAAAEIELVRFGILEIESRSVAAVLYFDYMDRIYLYNSGYDSEYQSLSVGLMAKILCIKDSIERGKHIFDFLKGRETYKARLGGETVPIYKVILEKQPR